MTPSPLQSITAEIDRIKGLAEGWQPISTAPKDGTKVLVWSERDKEIFACAFECGTWQTGVWPSNKAELTHWMPLPGMPSEPPRTSVPRLAAALEVAVRGLELMSTLCPSAAHSTLTAIASKLCPAGEEGK
jgi:hypothetical protein